MPSADFKHRGQAVGSLWGRCGVAVGSVPNNRHLGIFDMISHLPDALEQEKTERTEVRGVLQLLTFLNPRFPPVQMKSCPKVAGAGISLNPKTEVKTYDPHRKTTDYAD